MKLIISLSDKTPDFIKGMSFGRLFERMSKGENPVTNDGYPVRIENKEAIIKVCEAFNYTPVFGEEYYEEWISFMGIKNVSSKN